MAINKKGDILAYCMKTKLKDQKMFHAEINVFVNGERVTYQAAGYDAESKKTGNKMSVLMGRADVDFCLDKGTAVKGKGWDLIAKPTKAKKA